MEHLAKQMGVDVEAVAQMVEDGAPHLNIGGKVFFNLDQEFSEWLIKTYKVEDKHAPGTP
jgi:hypothetical protein